MAAVDFFAFVPEPERGRVFRMTRPVRIGDTNTIGRLRLDAAARYLQDVGNDDTLDLGVGDGGAWVCRKIELAVPGAYPVLRDRVQLATFCGGAGSRWVERRTTITAPGNARIETATLWVHLDPETRRPATVPQWFFDHYGDTVGTHRPDHRLHLADPPSDANQRTWPLRVTDFDVLAHVNNAIAFAALEDCWAREGRLDLPRRVTVEYHGPLDPGDAVSLQWLADDDALSCWLAVDGVVRVAVQASADVETGAE